MMKSRPAALAFATSLAATFAQAAFHEIHVKEVFAGSLSHPTAQYVLLQAYNPFQNAVTGHSVLTFGPTGVPTGTFTFPPNPGIGNNDDQMTIFVATADAAAIFGITADLAMTAVLDPVGGKVCWDGSTPDSCFAWGSYTGSDVGTPYNAFGGLISGYAARRRLDICLNIQELEVCDDTDDSANDWITVLPNPIRNDGTPGQTPPATCGNNTLEGLEGCDDGDVEGGDGCSAVCQVEPIDLVPGPLAVDTVELVPDNSNVNGVFEPGESVRIQPAWRYTGIPDIELTTQLANFTGPTSASPPFPLYMVSDGAASYGTMTTTDTASCDPASNCYRVHAATTGARPVQHWDATAEELLRGTQFALGNGDGNGPLNGVQVWTLHLGNSFPDVPADTPAPHPFYAFIENLFHNGVTGGCSGGNYCPADGVTRAQMAVFLLKAKFGSGHVPPPCTGTVFTDVPCTGGLFDPWIEELADLGITGGCGGNLYCPGNIVTRGQMAVFLLKALEDSTYDPPDCTGVFDDVACTPGAGFSDWIEELFARQITGGCSVTPPLYCPGNPNNRGQMAVFLVKTFGLLLYGFPAGPI
jgi:cysteine-rich repeat protein